MDEQIKAKLNQLNQTAEQAEPQTKQNTDDRLTEIEKALTALIGGETDE